MSQVALQNTFDQAIQRHRAGQLREAEQLYRQVLAQRPNHPASLHYLGVIALQTGQSHQAIDLIRRAIEIKPNYAEAHYNLGNALQETGQLDLSVESFKQAIAINPTLCEAMNNLGLSLKHLGLLDEAITAFKQAIAVRPDYADAFVNLGNAYKEQGQLDEAIEACRRGIAARPDLCEAHCNLGNALREKGDLDQAVAACRKGVELGPKIPETHNNLANALKESGETEEAIAAYRRAIELNPRYHIAHSNLIFALHYQFEGREITEELDRWNRRHAKPLAKFVVPHDNQPDPNRRIRIGYVSPDFRGHVVGRNLQPWLHLHDREKFEIYCYSQVLRPDAMTRKFEQRVDGWRNVTGIPDEQVDKQIREDRIDILVDLALHTGNNRLLVFARKPAPVQASYLGYCGSTGLETVDWRISDRFLDTPGADESCYTEKTLRLTKSYWCYHPGIEKDVSPAPPPAATNGFVTFGCQNNYCKISPATWDAWIEILRSLPNSKLLVYSSPGSHRDRARKKLADAGIDPARLVFSESRGKDYFLRYNEIDIALDPFPFGGGTTTCDALWMGVPVVARSGQSAVGRGGRSILGNLGLLELVADSTADYVRLAVDLANDPARMAQLRGGMRQRMLASPLMDGEGFVRDLEDVFRQMWQIWCEREKSGGRS
jgi:protein O-GlcNAc transferase